MNRAALPMHLLEETRPTTAENLALDEALLVQAEQTGTPVLRIWEPAEPAVILGASGRLKEDVHTDACLADGVRVYRRSSGGGTVVIGPGTLNVAVILPISLAPELTAVDTAQRFVLERLAATLREAGQPVEVLGSGDLAIAGRKCAGSAQRRLRSHFLVHTSILYDFPLELISRYTALPARQPAYRQNRSHAEFVINLSMSRAELVAAVRSAWLDSGHVAPRPDVPEALIAHLVTTKFADPAWTGRF